ncbi:MAG: hypothetical protein FJ026_05100, partial [Chloroflexi bacterium]|nr:hypothetical protein [Chloroflexota bacterium]
MTVFKHFTDDRPTGWRVSGRRVSLERWFSLGMILLVVVGAAYVGYTVNTAPQQVFLFPFLPLAALILLNPVIGLYLIIPVGHLVPYWVRVPTPVFDSPLEVVALFTIGAGAASWALRRTVWPRSWLYVPLAISVLILAMAWILRHGPEADARLYIFLATLLPFFSVIWLIDSPRKARILLLSMILSLLVQVVAVWLIVLGGGSQSALIFRDKGVMNDWLQLFRGNANPATHLSFLFSLVLASLMLAPRKWQRGYLFLMALVVIGGLVLTTYRAVLVNLGVVVIAVAMFGPKRVHGRLFISTVLPAVLFVMVGLLAQYQPGVQYLVDRWQRTDV